MTRYLCLLTASFAASFSLHQAQAFDLTAGLTPPNQQKTVIKAKGYFYESSQFPNESANVSILGLAFATPVQKEETQSLALAGRADQLKVFPSQSNYSELYDIEVGLTYTKILGEKRLWAFTGSYGSASDKPFYDPSVSTIGLTALYAFPKDAMRSWILLVNYSNNRPILNEIPLPGFAYFYTPSREFYSVVGVPFAVLYWKFSDDFSVNFFTLIPWTVKATVNYEIAGPIIQAYAGVDFSQMTFLPYGRPNRSDRLFYDEKKAFVGFKSPVSKEISFDIEAGHAFDRSFFVAENYQRDPGNALEIGNVFYFKLGLNSKF